MVLARVRITMMLGAALMLILGVDADGSLRRRRSMIAVETLENVFASNARVAPQTRRRLNGGKGSTKSAGAGKKKMPKSAKSGKGKSSKSGKGGSGKGMAKYPKGEEQQDPCDMFMCDFSMATQAPVITTTRAPQTPAPTPSPTLMPVTVSSAPVTPTPTAAPSDCLAGRTRMEYLTAVLSQAGAPVSSDTTTPQGMALDWLSNVDTGTDLCTYPTVTQRYGLALLYYSTDGPAWTNSTGWLSPVPECSTDGTAWFHVVCDPATNSYVTKLRLFENNLGGTIQPETLSFFPQLETLDLFTNSIAGPLPSIAGLSSLVLADFEANQFTGFGFEGLGATPVPLLTSYRVSTNRLRGTIPIAIANATGLKELWFARNQVTGTIPIEIGDLTDLEQVFMHENLLSGRIPTQLDNLTKLRELFAFNNMLSGFIPRGIFGFANLTQLRLQNNALSGDIPDGKGAMGLTDLWLEKNMLVGTLPAFLGSTTVLRNFLVGGNSLTGTLPVIPSNSLSFFDCRNNSLGGTIPDSIFQFSASLRFLYLQNNSFTGTIPPSFASAPLLRDLWLSNNQLSGTIPEVPATNLTLLDEFLVDGNNLSGSMPASVCALRNQSLQDLWADCAPPAEVLCDAPACCTRCFPESP